MTTRSNLQVISTVPSAAPPPVARAPSPVPGVAFAMVTLGLGIAWYAWARSGLDAALDAHDATALAQSVQSFETALAVQQRGLEAHARVLVDDARIRTTLATPGIDAATVEDVLADLRKASGHTLYAVLDARGVTRAAVGADSLRGVDLGSASLTKKVGGARSASEVWAIQDQPVVVAAAPVVFADELTAFLIVGDVVRAETLGPTAALIAGDRVLAGSADPIVLAAAALPAGTAQRVPGTTRVARTVALGEGAAGTVLAWTIERHQGRQALGVAAMLWMPLAVIGLGAIAASALALRAARIDSGGI